MKQALRKTRLFILRSVLALCALLFVALAALQIVLVAGVNSLSPAFFTDRINRAVADSGYHVAFDALSYDPLRGFVLRDLSVADTQGVFLTLDRFSVSVSFTSAVLRRLELSTHGGTLSWQRLPVSAPDPEDGPDSITPFTTPGIYVRTIDLSRLSFKRIVLGADIAGAPYAFAPALKARVTLDQSIALKLKLEPGMPGIAPGLPAPRTVKATAILTPETLAFTLNHLSASAPGYTLTARGTGSLAENGALDIAAQARHDNLGPLTEGLLKDAKADITIRGPLANPALDIAAAVTPGTLKARGLSGITATLQTTGLTQGMAHIASTFQDQPVTLQAALSYDAPLLHIAGLKGEAPALTLDGAGAYSTESNLFDGQLTLAAGDLAHYGDLLGVTLAGKMTLTADLKPGENAAQSVAFDAKVANGVYDGIKVRNLSAQAALASLDTPWPQSAKIDATDLQLPDDAATLDTLTAGITAAGPEQYALSVKGRGHAPVALSFDGTALLSNLTQDIPTARDIVLTLTHGGSSAKLTGAFAPDHVDLKLAASGVRGRDIPAPLPGHLADMRLDLAAAMTGAPARPHTNLTAALSGIGAGAYRDAALNITAAHDGEKVTGNLAGRGTGIRALTADVNFPVTLSLLPFNLALSGATPLAGSMTADIDLAALAPLVLTPAQRLAGQLTGGGTIAGTLAAPAPSGTLNLSGASFEDSANGIVLADIAAAARFTPNALTLTSLSATDGRQGRLDGSGTLALGSGATDIALRLRDFNIPRGDLANGLLGADLSLKGASGDLRLSGAADIAEMHILIPETFESSIPQLNIVGDKKDSAPGGMLDRLALDVKIDAHNQVFVRGWGLDAEFGGSIAVTGTAAAPQFNGTLSSRRGRFEEFGKRFTLTRADLRFQGAVPPSPYLDVEATTPAGDVTGAIQLTGSVQSPAIAFTSTPALPKDEVLSRILFGREAARISPFQAIQLARTLQRFSGQGGGAGLDPLGLLRSATGFDDISIDTDDNGAASVDVGKYLTDKVYLELGKGKSEDSGAATIQIELTPSINIESRLGQDAQGGGGIFWKRDY